MSAEYVTLGQDVFMPNLFLTQESYTLWQSIDLKGLSIAGNNHSEQGDDVNSQVRCSSTRLFVM